MHRAPRAEKVPCAPYQEKVAAVTTIDSTNSGVPQEDVAYMFDFILLSIARNWRRVKAGLDVRPVTNPPICEALALDAP